jgi:flavin-dependent dehydrogenase
MKHQVLIAGSGPAACALALRLLDDGFGVSLMPSTRKPCSGAEMLSSGARALLDELGALRALGHVGVEEVDSFESVLHGSRTWRVGPYFHVERAKLAVALLKLAQLRGATVVPGSIAPELFSGRDGTWNASTDVIAMVDASGRAACWSRPLARAGKAVAWTYQLAAEKVRPGCFAETDEGWGYRIGTRDGVTVGWVPKEPRNRQPTRALLALLDVELGRAVSRARPASPQWSSQPAVGIRLSVGDAALAHDPVSGQGVQFALASAFAAGAAIRTWALRPHSRALATDYYRDFVRSHVARHLRYSRPPNSTPTLPSARGQVVFSAATRTVGAQVAGLIEPLEAAVLGDGSAVRWLGSFDVLALRRLASVPIDVHSLLTALRRYHGIEGVHGRQLLEWCLTKGVLSAAM